VKQFTAEHVDAGTYRSVTTAGLRQDAVIALLRSLQPGDKLTIVRTA
jgi:hypothetical protein